MAIEGTKEGGEAESALPLTNLRIVEHIVRDVCQTLHSLSAKSEDVKLASRYLELAEQFPITFLAWAAGRDNGARDPALLEKLRESPLFAQFAAHFDVGIAAAPMHPLPTVCIEALVYYSEEAKDRIGRLQAEKKAKKALAATKVANQQAAAAQRAIGGLGPSRIFNRHLLKENIFEELKNIEAEIRGPEIRGPRRSWSERMVNFFRGAR